MSVDLEVQDTAVELAEQMRESWLSLDRERHDFWLELAKVVVVREAEIRAEFGPEEL